MWLALLAPCVLSSQERGAVALGEAVLGLGVNTRVLMIGAHPDDEDTFLIAWLSRGRHVETAYLSLTRGDGGQNLIGNELGEALGVIRTQELLAARRIDGGRQFFTRAYDFGFSKDTADTYGHWAKDSILGDVIRVVRSLRPHVIIAVFSGTPRDGHGQHQVSGLLAREAYDLAGDTARFPAVTYGDAWAPAKFYRTARFNAQNGTLVMDVGEYSPLLGRTYAEIAGESRSQHKSQGFGAPQRRGPLPVYLRREATRVNEATAPQSETSLFDGIDTTWARVREAAGPQGFLFDSLPAVFAAVRAAYDPFAPEKLLAPLSRAALFIQSICPPTPINRCTRIERGAGRPRLVTINPDLASSVDNARIRVQNAMRLASGIEVDGASLEVLPLDTLVPILTSIYNRSRDTVAVSGGMATGRRPSMSATRLLAPGGVLQDTLVARIDSISQPWWLAGGRTGAMFNLPAGARAESNETYWPGFGYTVDLGGRRMGETITFVEPVEFALVDDVKGEVRHRVAAAPAVTIKLDHTTQYVSANVAIDRAILVRVRSAAEINPREARVSLRLPLGLVADSASRTVRLPIDGREQSVAFRVRGRLAAGEHRIEAVAESGGQAFRAGYDLIDYDHIRRQRVYRPAAIRISAVDVRIPTTLRVGYVPGVSDNVAPALAQLGIPVTVIPARELARMPLTGFTTIVVGPRAYEASADLVAANARLMEFARRGGTVVVQYGQYEMMQPGIMPYPITISRPHDRVTHEDAPVTILDPSARELTFPNRMAQSDFAGWVQERSLYMPRTFDERYRPLLAMNDPGEAPNRGGILVAPLGSGRYIYTTLAFFRQLPAGVPGAARLFVNLLSAAPAAPRTTQ